MTITVRPRARVTLLASALCLAAFAAACEKGPAEKAGKDLDKAAQKTGDAVKDATRK